MQSPSRHAAPMIVDAGGPARSLERIELGRGSEDGQRREAFVQQLVHDHPTIVPMLDIEPAFTPMVSVCQELATSAGYLDNLWITPAGGIVLGECKLVRNPQARREVVAQALDYARSLKGWHYDDLEKAIRSATGNPALTLWGLIEDQTDLSEDQFVDAVERRLRTGRFMLLIIGDGIQEGVEALTDFLQLHAGLHTGIALIDLSIWRDGQGRLLVVPRIPMRTLLIERGIVVVDEAGVRVEPPRTNLLRASGSSPARPMTASEPEFFAQLDQKAPGMSQPLRSFIEKIAAFRVVPDYRKTLVLRWYPSSDIAGSAGFIDTSGRVWVDDAWNTANRLGYPSAGEEYLATVAALIGGSIRRYDAAAPSVKTADGKTVDLGTLLRHADGWAQAIGRLVAALQ